MGASSFDFFIITDVIPTHTVLLVLVAKFQFKLISDILSPEIFKFASSS